MTRSLPVALLAAATAIAARAVFWWQGVDALLLGGERLVGWPWLLAGWLAGSVLVVHAWLLGGRRLHAEESASRDSSKTSADIPITADRVLSRRRVAGVWLGLAVLNVWLWPYPLLPERFTVAAFLYWGSWLLFPVAIAEGLPDSERLRRRVDVYLSGLTWGALAAAVIASGVYLGRARPYVGSVDFFFAVCNARDMLADPALVPRNAYRYFPGAYAFWRTVMQYAGQSLATLQGAVIAALIVNAVLCSAVVIRTTRSYAAGVYASVWYLVAASRFQGLTGVMEPLATIPFLAGLLLWGGLPLRGSRGLLLAASWGACLGLTVWFKQQAGLLSLGAGWLLINRLLAPRQRRHQWLPLVCLPLCACGILLAALRAEGHGWLPLRQGLGMLSSYASEGSWLGNLYVQLRGDESAAVAALMLAVSLVAILLSGVRRRRLLGAAWLEVAGFAALAALATLLQFRTRAYGHYMLLAVPALVLASVTLALSTVPRFLRGADWSGLRRGLLLLAASLPLAHTAGNPATLHVWRVLPPADFRPQQLWHQQPRVAADLERLRAEVEPGERLYVLPPRHHSVHYLLGTRAPEPWGYSFRVPDLETMPWQRFDAVLLLTGALDESDRRLWTANEQSLARESLQRQGFQVRLRRPSFVLYRRDDRESASSAVNPAWLGLPRVRFRS